MRALGLVATSVFLALACESGAPAAPTPAAATLEAPAPEPPTTKRDELIATDDGRSLAATLYTARSGSAALVLVHSQDADRTEWDPLVERLVKASKRYSVLTYDQRSHGASPVMAGKTPADELLRQVKDLEAALAHVQKIVAPKATVLIGSSLGAALVATVAERSANVSALGLLSPGQAIMGLDLYRPYAKIRDIPTFIAGAAEDAVSREPLDILGKMSSAGTVKTYAGKAHTARLLGAAEPALWSDLESWLSSVFEAGPRPARELDAMPGLAPAKSIAKHQNDGSVRERGGGSR